MVDAVCVVEIGGREKETRIFEWRALETKIGRNRSVGRDSRR